MSTYEEKVTSVWEEVGDSKDEWNSLLSESDVDQETSEELLSQCGRGEAGMESFFCHYPILLDSLSRTIHLRKLKRKLADADNNIEEATAQLQAITDQMVKKRGAIPQASADLRDAIIHQNTAAVIGQHPVLTKKGKAPYSAAHDHSGHSCDRDKMLAYASKLADLWKNKEGTILDELVDNLKSPTEAARLPRIQAVCRTLKQVSGSHYKGLSSVELVCLYLYTMSAPDIDNMMGHKAPAHNTDGYDSYKAKNPVVFRSVNWAMRTATEREESWGVVQKWIKFIVLLIAIGKKVGNQKNGPAQALSRGLAALPQSVISDHEKMAIGAALFWPAPSSCAVDPKVSEDYINGAAANATKTDGDKNNCLLYSINPTGHGIPLHNISKYPDETEVLLSPLTEFTVEKVQDHSSNKYLEVTLSCRGTFSCPVLDDVCSQALAEASKASQLIDNSPSDAAVIGIYTARVEHLQRWNNCRAAISKEVNEQKDLIAALEEEKRKAEVEEGLKKKRIFDLQKQLAEEMRKLAAIESRKADLGNKLTSQNSNLRVLTVREENADDEATRLASLLAGSESEVQTAKDSVTRSGIDASRETERQKRILESAKKLFRDAENEKSDKENELKDIEANRSDLSEEVTRIETLRKQETTAPLIEQEIRVCEQRFALKRHEAEHRSAIKQLTDSRAQRQQQQQQQQRQKSLEGTRAASVTSLPYERSP